jgi:hypothetical protein
MALDCKKLINLTESTRTAQAENLRKWLVPRQEDFAKGMTANASRGVGYYDIGINPAETFGLRLEPTTQTQCIDVCTKAVKDLVGEEAKVSATIKYQNVIVRVTWKD